MPIRLRCKARQRTKHCDSGFDGSARPLYYPFRRARKTLAGVARRIEFHRVRACDIRTACGAVLVCTHHKYLLHTHTNTQIHRNERGSDWGAYLLKRVLRRCTYMCGVWYVLLFSRLYGYVLCKHSSGGVLLKTLTHIFFAPLCVCQTKEHVFFS